MVSECLDLWGGLGGLPLGLWGGLGACTMAAGTPTPVCAVCVTVCKTLWVKQSSKMCTHVMPRCLVCQTWKGNRPSFS